MLFSSVTFLFFFLPITLLGYYLLDRRFKNIFLLIVSLFFYAWGEPKFVFVMVFSIFVNYLFGLLVVRRTDKGYQKLILTLMVIFNISIFFVFKYLNFVLENLNYITGDMFPQTNIALPIGISFFTFQAMSYVFDVQRGRGQVQKNPFNVALYVALFPQLIAGPIVRYETVAAEIAYRNETVEDFAQGIQRFIIGLSKKVIIANTFAILADRAFGYTDFSQLTVAMAWLGAIAYTIQIYFDFSGYSDMAIGLGLMFGFHFEENFNYPYISKSISEFWRRWHMSLGSWFRDYVYFPLGGSRVASKKRLILNLLAVWFLTGVWHGAAWNFIVWGMMYFVLIAFEKQTGFPEKLSNSAIKQCYRIITLLMVVLGWVLFRATDLTNGLCYIGSMFGLTGNAFTDVLSTFLWKDSIGILLFAAVASTPVVKFINTHFLKNRDIPLIKGFLHAICFVVALGYIVNSAYDPFIYFNF